VPILNAHKNNKLMIEETKKKINEIILGNAVKCFRTNGLNIFIRAKRIAICKMSS
jgi:hypothetical protein